MRQAMESKQVPDILQVPLGNGTSSVNSAAASADGVGAGVMLSHTAHAFTAATPAQSATVKRAGVRAAARTAGADCAYIGVPARDSWDSLKALMALLFAATWQRAAFKKNVSAAWVRV